MSKRRVGNRESEPGEDLTRLSYFFFSGSQGEKASWCERLKPRRADYLTAVFAYSFM